MFQRSVTARACTLLVATLVLVPLACAQGGGAGDGGDKESICDEQQKQLVSFCYSKKSMEKCQDPEAARRGCVWCPSFMTRVGTRDLCRATLACGIWVHWDLAPDYMQFQNGCVSEYSTDAPQSVPHWSITVYCIITASLVLLPRTMWPGPGVDAV